MTKTAQNVLIRAGERESKPSQLSAAESEQIDIKNMIYAVRNQQVMIDSDLARLYQVETKRLNEAVKRNIARFPEEFRFQLTKDEYIRLRTQFVTLN